MFFFIDLFLEQSQKKFHSMKCKFFFLFHFIKIKKKKMIWIWVFVCVFFIAVFSCLFSIFLVFVFVWCHLCTLSRISSNRKFNFDIISRRRGTRREEFKKKKTTFNGKKNNIKLAFPINEGLLLFSFLSGVFLIASCVSFI